MNVSCRGRLGTWWFIAFWALLLAAAAYYLYAAFVYVAESEPQPGSTWLGRQLWYLAHIAFALPIFLIAPLQFAARLRWARPAVHRILGRLFLSTSILAGLLATYLGLTIEFEGSRLPLTLFGMLWVLFSVAAWICARRGDYAAHRAFAIRGFTIALAFIWLRFFATIEETAFWFIEAGEVRMATREWVSLVIPMLVVEAWLSWWPGLRRAMRRGADLSSTAPRAI